MEKSKDMLHFPAMTMVTIQPMNGKFQHSLFYSCLRVHHEYDEYGSVQHLLMLNRNENTDVTCVSDGFQHFLWNILHLFVEIHELFVYSKG